MSGLSRHIKWVFKWGPTLISVSLAGPMTSSVGSTVFWCPRAIPFCICPACSLGRPSEVFSLQSKPLAIVHAATPDFALMVWLRVYPMISRSFNNLTMDVAIKPQHPNSNGHIAALQPRSSASAASSVYRSFVLSKASCTASS